MLVAAMVVSMIIPGGNAGGTVGRFLEDLTLVLVLAGSFFLPGEFWCPYVGDYGMDTN